MTTSDFPNLFFVYGPQAPSVLANSTSVIVSDMPAVTARFSMLFHSLDKATGSPIASSSCKTTTTLVLKPSEMQKKLGAISSSKSHRKDYGINVKVLGTLEATSRLLIRDPLKCWPSLEDYPCISRSAQRPQITGVRDLSYRRKL